MSHARKLILDGSIMTLSQMGVFLISIFFSAYILRVLPKEEVAIMALPIIFEGLISLIKDFGLATSAIKQVPGLWKRKRYQRAKGMIRTAWYTPLVASLVIAASMLIFKNQLSEIFLKTNRFGLIIPWVIFYALAGTILNQQFLLLQALQKFRTISWINFIVQLTQKIVSFLFLLKWGIVGYLIGFGLTTWMGVVIGVIALRKYLIGKAIYPKITDIIKQSFPYYLSGYARYLFYQADQLVVALLMGPTTLAVYFVIRSIIRQIILFWDTFFVPLSPKLAELRSAKHRIELIANLRVMFNLLFWGLVILTILVILFSRIGLDIYTGGNYSEFSWLMRLMALMLIPYGLLTLVGAVVFILGTSMDRLKLELFTGITSVALQGLMVPRLELLGAGMAQVACFSLALFYGLWLLKGMNIKLVTGKDWWKLNKQARNWLALEIKTGFDKLISKSQNLADEKFKK